MLKVCSIIFEITAIKKEMNNSARGMKRAITRNNHDPAGRALACLFGP